MPRKPKPIELQLLKGAHRNDPSRLAGRIEALKIPRIPLGDPPAYFLVKAPGIGYQRAEKLHQIWDECRAKWEGRIFEADSFALETVCLLLFQQREAYVHQHKFAPGALSALVKLTTMFEERAPEIGMGADDVASDPRAEYMAKRAG
jgi:hypothetical protein